MYKIVYQWMGKPSRFYSKDLVEILAGIHYISRWSLYRKVLSEDFQSNWECIGRELFY